MGRTRLLFSIIGNNLNGSSIAIADADGNPADLSGADVTFPGLAVGATVTSVSANPAQGSVGPRATVTFSVVMSEPVTVTGGRPTLLLNDTGVATYRSGSGTNVLTFNYTVGGTGSGQNVPALAVTGFSLNGATVYDSGVRADTADLSAVTSFAAGPAVDTTAPTVSSVIADPGSGDFGVGSTVTLTVNFSEAVSVNGGTPTLALSGGGSASFVNGSGTSALTFSYVVGAGQNTADLAVNGLNLHGATITDAAGNKAILSGVATNPQGVLRIDTKAPTALSVTAGPSTGDLGVGDTVTLTVTFSEAVTVADGTPILTLNDLGTANYSGGSSTNALTFTYTVAAGENTPNLGVTGVIPNGATIRDGAGNDAILTGAQQETRRGRSRSIPRPPR